MTRILITGSRTFTSDTVIHRALRAAWFDLGSDPEAILVSGGCPDGADALAEKMWAESGLTVEQHPADWTRYGKAAGLIRNSHMVSLGADICLAFVAQCAKPEHARYAPHDSHGATHTLTLARRVGIPTITYREDGTRG